MEATAPIIVKARAKPKPLLLPTELPRAKAKPKPLAATAASVDSTDYTVGPFVVTPVNTDVQKGYYIFGPTYELRESLKELYCRWNPSKRGWYLPANSLEAGLAILREAAAAVPPVTDRTVKQYESLADIMDSLRISDVTRLVRLRPGKLDELLGLLKVHEDAVTYTLSERAGAARLDEGARVQLLLDTMAGKLCRCIKKVRAGNSSLKESNAIAICISTIFINRGLQMHGFSCDGERGVLNPSKEGIILESR